MTKEELIVFFNKFTKEELDIISNRMFFKGHVHAKEFSAFLEVYEKLNVKKEYTIEFSIENILLSITLPTLAHGFFDFCLFSGSGIVLLIYLVFLVFLYIIAFKKVKQLSNIKVNLDNSVPENVKVLSRNYYCSNCGRPVVATYCAYCGKKVN